MTNENENVRWLALDGARNARVVVPGALLCSDNRTADRATRPPAPAASAAGRRHADPPGGGARGARADSRRSRARIEHRSLYPRSGGNTDLDADSVNLWPPTGPSLWPDEPRVVQAYLSYVTARPDSIAASIRTIASARGAVLVHCAAGKDRTGMVVALALDAAGVDRGAIASDYLATAERIDAIMALSRIGHLPARARRARPAGARPAARHDRASARDRRRGVRRIRHLALGERHER